MSCFRIFDTNYVDLDILANSDVTSEQLPAFPVTSAYNGLRRAKVWRSAGYYEVTASNNQIVFRETTAGADLLATITPGNYQRTAFLTAIKTALEAVGASTYTVTFGSMFKVVITSNGVGGGGDFDLILSDVDSTAYSLLGFDNVDLTGALAYTADSIKLHTSEGIIWDLGIDSNPEAFALIGARNSPLSISPNAVVKLQGNHTNVWTSPAFEQTLTYDDRILHLIGDDGIATEALRYWRVYFVDQNPKGYIEVGAFYLGGVYQTDRGAPQFPFRTDPIDRTETLYSEGGQTFSEIKPKTERFTVDWSALTIEEKERFELIFQEVGKGVPFFVSMDTPPAFSSSQQYYIRYVKFADEPTFTLTRPNFFKTTMTFEEQL
jgi:hypothetical protein